MGYWLTFVAIQIVINLLCHYLLTGILRRVWKIAALFAFPVAVIIWPLIPLIQDVLQTPNVSVGIVWGHEWLVRGISVLLIQLLINRLLFRK